MNLPNKLSILRIILVPFVLFFFLFDGIVFGKYIALALFIIAALTDMLDGQIARKYNLVTDMGKFLDPIADKLLTSCSLFMLCASCAIPAIWGVVVLSIVISREFMITGLRQIAATKGVVIAADKWGKWKTVSQIIAISSLILAEAISGVKWIYHFGWVILGISVVLAIISGINYMVINRSVLKEKK